GLDLAHLGAIDDLDVRAAAGAGAEDELGLAVEVEVVGRDANAASEAGVEGEEAPQQGGVGDLAVGLELTQLGAIDELDVRAAAGAGADDDVGPPVVVDVVRTDGDAAGEAGVEGEEAAQQAVVAAVEHLDVGAAARSGADD